MLRLSCLFLFCSGFFPFSVSLVCGSTLAIWHMHTPRSYLASINFNSEKNKEKHGKDNSKSSYVPVRTNNTIIPLCYLPALARLPALWLRCLDFVICFIASAVLCAAHNNCHYSNRLKMVQFFPFAAFDSWFRLFSLSRISFARSRKKPTKSRSMALQRVEYCDDNSINHKH